MENFLKKSLGDCRKYYSPYVVLLIGTRKINMLRSLLRQFTGCREDSAIDDITYGRNTWAPIPSPSLYSDRYANIRNVDTSFDPELQRDYQECRDHLEKECRLAQSRTKVAMRIHARDQGQKRKVNVALARAKRAEGLVTALRHENSSLRAKLKMLDDVGLNPPVDSSSSSSSRVDVETPTTKNRRVSMLRGDPSTSVNTPPTQRGDYVAKKMNVALNTKRTSKVASNSVEPSKPKDEPATMPSTNNAVDFLDAISSDLPRVSGSLAKSKTYGDGCVAATTKRQPLGVLKKNENSADYGDDIQTIEL